MKSVLISINPRWCELIASDKKTIEVRKTRPKLETPFKCYIYCTIGKSEKDILSFACFDSCKYMGRFVANGKVIGEFICDKIDEHICTESKYGLIYKYDTVSIKDEKAAFLEFGKLEEYGGGNPLYFWHISDLVIYDKPRELSEFKQVRVIRGYHKKDEPKTEGINIQHILHSKRVEVKYLTRPPQSWCYVESERE